MDEKETLTIQTDVIEKQQEVTTSLCDRFGVNMYSQKFLEQEKIYHNQFQETQNEVLYHVMTNTKTDAREAAFKTVLHAETQEVLKKDYTDNQNTPVKFDSDIDYIRNLKGLVEKVQKESTEERAPQIPVLPEVLYMDMLPNYPSYRKEKGLFPIGIETESLTVQYLDMEEGPALILGGSKTGKTNAMRGLLNIIDTAETYLFDGANCSLSIYAERPNIQYAGSKESAQVMLEQLKKKLDERKELFEEAKIENVMLSAKTFFQSIAPVYVLIDSMQELYEQLEEDNQTFDILADAVQGGVYLAVTAEHKIKKMTRSKFIDMMLSRNSALILGNVREQTVFSVSGIREENRQTDIGYDYSRGNIKKLKLIDNR